MGPFPLYFFALAIRGGERPPISEELSPCYRKGDLSYNINILKDVAAIND